MPRQPLELHMAAVALINDGDGVLMVESKYPGMKESFWSPRIRGTPLGGVWTYRWGGSGPWNSEGPAELIAAPANIGMAD